MSMRQEGDGPGEPGPEDWDAFARLYDEYAARLYRVACLLLPGQAAAAEDAVAETFITVHRAWIEGRIDDLLRFARSALVDHVVGTFRSHQAAVGPPERPLDDDVADPPGLFAALARIPDRRRTALVLHLYEEVPYQGIAEAMDISVGAAEAHALAGVQQLRELIAGVA
jgi:DNA-directed RNA polymerase specialized sigma24 family protein